MFRLVVVHEVLLVLKAKLADRAVNVVSKSIVCHQAVNGAEVGTADAALVYVLDLGMLREFFGCLNKQVAVGALDSLLVLLGLTVRFDSFCAGKPAITLPAVIFGHLVGCGENSEWGLSRGISRGLICVGPA